MTEPNRNDSPFLIAILLLFLLVLAGGGFVTWIRFQRMQAVRVEMERLDMELQERSKLEAIQTQNKGEVDLSPELESGKK